MEEKDHAAEDVVAAMELILTPERRLDDEQDLEVSTTISAKRKAADDEEDVSEGAQPAEEGPKIFSETVGELGDGDDDNAVQYASIMENIAQPIVADPPPKKKAKAKAGAKGAKSGLKDANSDRASIATEEMGTLEVESPKETKRPKKKAAAAKGKKRKASFQISASSTPAPDQVDSAILQERDDEQQEDDKEDEEDRTKIHCICKACYDDERAMIACDHCDEWFHADCMNIKEEHVNLVAFFFCTECEPLTSYRTEYYSQCSRDGCLKPVKVSFSRYCSDECGLLEAVSKISKAKQLKGMTTLAIVEKLASSQVINASKREGVAQWADVTNQRQWLQQVLDKDTISITHVDDLDEGMLNKAFELPEMEMLSRMECRKVELEIMKSKVIATIDSLAARTTLLHLAEDRAPHLEPLQDGEDNRLTNGKKGDSKSKKIKEEDGVVIGQPRCGYDDRLGWNDARFHKWCQTADAKDILANRMKLDGNLCIDEEGLIEGEAAICGKSRRKCKQHLDWSGIRAADLEADRDLQSELLTTLNDEEEHLIERVKELQLMIKDTIVNEEEKRRERDAALARQLASEGTRRAITSM